MDSDVSHRLSGGSAGVRTLLDAISDQLARGDVPDVATMPVLIACDEIVSNVVRHGGEARRVEVAVSVRDGLVSVEVVDDGAPFDPTAADPPDVSLSVEDRDIGGLGIHLVREMMEGVAYERRADRNHLRFSRRFARPSGS